MFKKLSQSFYGLSTKEMTKKYKISNEVLGQGAFSEVKKAYGKVDGRDYAVKLMNKSTLSASGKHVLTLIYASPRHQLLALNPTLSL